MTARGVSHLLGAQRRWALDGPLVARVFSALASHP